MEENNYSIRKILFIASIVFISVLSYSIFTQPFEDVIKYSSIVTGILFLSFIITMIQAYFNGDKRAKEIISDLGGVGYLLLISLFLGPFLYGSFILFKDFSILDRDSNFSIVRVIFTVLIAFFFGVMLYLIRRNARSFFGLFEVFLGLVIAGYKAFNNENIFSIEIAIALLGASVFLIVRGLDNIQQGENNEPKDKLWIKLFNKKKLIH